MHARDQVRGVHFLCKPFRHSVLQLNLQQQVCAVTLRKRAACIRPSGPMYSYRLSPRRHRFAKQRKRSLEIFFSRNFAFEMPQPNDDKIV
jgi:hypothetical protein